MTKDECIAFLEQFEELQNMKHEENVAYDNWKLKVKQLSSDNNIIFTEQELEDIFSKPSPILDNNEIIYDENGSPLNQEEFSVEDGQIKFSEITDFGWLCDEQKRDELIKTKFYQKYIFKGIGDIPKEVRKSIERHALHILGRCNNPSSWEKTPTPQKKLDQWIVPSNNLTNKVTLDNHIDSDKRLYWDNKQGLVYGMVQSGKTASMIALMGLAHCSGFKFIIVLSGDKTSLRNQTQKRINDAFKLHYTGSPNGHSEKIRSITTPSKDYSYVTDGQSGLDVFRDDIINNHTVIICVKKNTSNLKKLFSDLKDVNANQNLIPNFNFGSDLKALIIDDEADYASQNTKSNSNSPSTINQDISNFRELLPQNTYVAYTATPQACLGADPENLVGYPKHFIWLLDPFRDDKGNTTSYLGLQEFFISDFKNDLIYPIDEFAWPHWVKDSTTGKKEGVMDFNGNITTDIKLKDAENDTIKIFLDDDKKRKLYCKDYRIALTDFFITCAVRWHRHYIKQKQKGFFDNDLPTIRDIQAINQIGKQKTSFGFETFPYHAMMFNLAYITEIHENLEDLIGLLIDEVKADFKKTKKDNWVSPSLFVNQYQKQLDKTYTFEKPTLPTKVELQKFIEFAINIACARISGSDKYLYILNSSDEGLTLRYNANDKDLRPKKSAIMIGGLILGRGLTVENLSTSVFIRSQSLSLGDTNLQMCRWFGHKKKDLDLQSVYMQQHSKNLFENIAYADKDLRSQFMELLYKNTRSECILLQLQNSPLFKVTSPAKSKFLIEGHKSSYSGKTVKLEHPMMHNNYKENYKKLEDFLSSLPTGEFMNERAMVFKDIGTDKFRNFFNGLNIHKDARLVIPKDFDVYLDDWYEFHKKLPKVTIAVFGYYEHLCRAQFKDSKGTYRVFLGGKHPNGEYIGDQHVDKPKSFHIDNYSLKGLKRDKFEDILIMFYKLNPNYVNKKDTPKSSPEVIDGYKEIPVLTYAISSPLGGPVYKIYENESIRAQRMANNCID